MNAIDSDINWKITPMSEEKEELDYSAEFTADEFSMITEGFIPLDMDDKWLIKFKDNKLNFYRSWTGTCIFQVEFEEKENSFFITRAIANRNPDQYKSVNSEYDIKFLDFLINALLLKKQDEFPVPLEIKEKMQQGDPNLILSLYKHTTVGPVQTKPPKETSSRIIN